MKNDFYFGILYLIGFILVVNSAVLVSDYIDRRNNPSMTEVNVLSVVEKKYCSTCDKVDYIVLVEKMDGAKLEFEVGNAIGVYLLNKDLPCKEKLEIPKDDIPPFGLKLFLSSIISIVFFVILACKADDYKFMVNHGFYTVQLPMIGCILSGLILISPLIF